MNSQTNNVYTLTLKDGQVSRLTVNILKKGESSYTVQSVYSSQEQYESEVFSSYEKAYAHLLEIALDEALNHSHLRKVA